MVFIPIYTHLVTIKTIWYGFYTHYAYAYYYANYVVILIR